MSDQSLPHDHEAEQSVLGAMMLSIDVLDEIAEIVSGGDFYRPAHESVFNAITGLREAGSPVDVRTVAATLAESGDLQRVGGVLYLHGCVEAVPTVANGTYYARIVADRAMSRRLVEAGQRISQLGLRSGGLSGAGVDLSSAVELSQEAVFAITNRGADDFAVLGDMLQPTLDDIEKAAGMGDDVQGVPTGFLDLDRLLNGLHPGQLIIVAGRPGLGKSTLSMDFARHAAIRHKQASAIFSLEMSRIEMVMRLLSAESRVPLHVMRSGHLTDDDWAKLAKRMGEIGDAPLFLDDTPSMTLADIRAKARRLKQRHDLKLLVVDYLQLMSSPKRTESRQQEVSDLSRGLKLLAKEIECPIVAVSQLNRGPEQRQDKRPQKSDLRESGSLEQDADVIILLHREDAYDKESARAGEADLIVDKHRNGPTDTITVAAQLHLSRFVDMAIA